MKLCPVIAGTTAVGKTGLVVRLAGRFPIEVISLDSRQIYRGLRIGTAQPDEEELAACRHHLVDFIDPRQKYSAARFRRDFESAWQGIRTRGAVPVLVGGAGMYLSTLREGLFQLPPDAQQRLPEVRAELDALSDSDVRKQLAEADPASCERIHENDRYRSQRALEIHRLSGQTMTELLARRKADPSLGLDFPVFLLQREREELSLRIAERTRLMLRSGWLEETAALLEDYPRDCPGLMSIGYREISAHLAGELDRNRMETRIVEVTRQYARRQRTWFRSIKAETIGHPQGVEIPAALDRCLTECCEAAVLDRSDGEE